MGNLARSGLKIVFLVILSLGGLFIVAPSQPKSSGAYWSNYWRSPLGRISCNDLAFDTQGSIFVVGQFGGVADFNPGWGIDWCRTRGGTDAFVSRMSSDGNMLWISTYGAARGDFMTHAAASKDCLYSVLDSQIAPNSVRPRLRTSIKAIDMTGKEIWTAAWGGETGHTSISDIAVDGDGSVLALGTFSGQVDVDPGPAVDWCSAEDSDVLLVKVSREGNLVWRQVLGGDEWDSALCVSVDKTGHVYVMWESLSETVEKTMASHPGTLSPQSDASLMLTMLDGASGFCWERCWFRSAGNMRVWDMAACADGVYVAGTLSGPVAFDPLLEPDEQQLCSPIGRDYMDGFVLKIGDQGDLKWARTWGGRSRNFPLRLAVGQDGEVFVAGHFTGTTDLGPGSSALTVDAKPFKREFRGFLSALHSDGAFTWARADPRWEMCTALSADDSGALFLAGLYCTSAIIGGRGAFLIKLPAQEP